MAPSSGPSTFSQVLSTLKRAYTATDEFLGLTLANLVTCANDAITIGGGAFDIIVLFGPAYSLGIETAGGSVVAYNAAALYTMHAMDSASHTVVQNCVRF